MPDHAAQDGEMLLIISASASKTSRSEKLGDYVASLFKGPARAVEHLRLRTLPAEPLLAADVADPAIAGALAMLEKARAVVIVTPTYKGTFTGLLKVFVDLLPQYALRDKIILPLATGGSIAHMLMLDYGLRPMLQTMWPRHISQGCFVLDTLLVANDAGRLEIDPAELPLLAEVLDGFGEMLEARTARI